MNRISFDGMFCDMNFVLNELTLKSISGERHSTSTSWVFTEFLVVVVVVVDGVFFLRYRRSLRCWRCSACWACWAWCWAWPAGCCWRRGRPSTAAAASSTSADSNSNSRAPTTTTTTTTRPSCRPPATTDPSRLEILPHLEAHCLIFLGFLLGILGNLGIPTRWTRAQSAFMIVSM